MPKAELKVGLALLLHYLTDMERKGQTLQNPIFITYEADGFKITPSIREAILMIEANMKTGVTFTYRLDISIHRRS